MQWEKYIKDTSNKFVPQFQSPLQSKLIYSMYWFSLRQKAKVASKNTNNVYSINIIIEPKLDKCFFLYWGLDWITGYYRIKLPL